MTPRDQIRSILAEIADVPARDDADLALDSLTLVTLVETLEDALGLRIAARDVTRANFATVDAIVAFVETKS